MKPLLRSLVTRSLFLLGSLAAATPAFATDAGWRHLELPATASRPTIPVALYYPTATTARTISMGPFQVNVAIQAPAAERFKALIVLSHGIAGSELGHSSLAESLARSGYLVAALRHPGDNWQDHTLIEKTPAQYFVLRPLALSQLIDGILALPEWADRIGRDEKGPLVGALGHSAGGFSVIALAGGRADPRRVHQHCLANFAQDPVFCGVGETPRSGAAPALQEASPVRNAASPAATKSEPAGDPRVRAVVAMAPAGVAFTSESLAAIKTPILVYYAELDRFLVPRFHAQRIARDMPAAELRPVSNAWHFAFMDTPTVPLDSADGDVRADPPGFDRAALLKRLAVEIPAFFDKTLLR